MTRSDRPAEGRASEERALAQRTAHARIARESDCSRPTACGKKSHESIPGRLWTETSTHMPHTGNAPKKTLQCRERVSERTPHNWETVSPPPKHHEISKNRENVVKRGAEHPRFPTHPSSPMDVKKVSGEVCTRVCEKFPRRPEVSPKQITAKRGSLKVCRWIKQ